MHMPQYCYFKKVQNVDQIKIAFYYSNECTDDISKYKIDFNCYKNETFLQFDSFSGNLNSSLSNENFQKYHTLTYKSEDFIIKLLDLINIKKTLIISNVESIEYLIKNYKDLIGECSLMDFILEFTLPFNRNAMQSLILYLDLNGINRTETNGNGNSRNDDNGNGSKDETNGNENGNENSEYYSNGNETLYSNYLHDSLFYNPSIIDKLDFTKTNLGKTLLISKTKGPIDLEWIDKLNNFIKRYGNDNKIKRLRNLIKEVTEVPEHNEVINFDATFFADKSANTNVNMSKFENENVNLFGLRSGNECKSIYSKLTLEETSILKYRRDVSHIRNIKKNLKTIYKIKQIVIEILNEPMECNENYSKFKKSTSNYEFESLNLLLTSGNDLSQINEILSIIQNEDSLQLSSLYDPLCFVLLDGTDGYLDICRKVYQVKIEECQNVGIKAIENKELDIHLSDEKEICIKGRVLRNKSNGDKRSGENRSGENRSEGQRSEDERNGQINYQSNCKSKIKGDKTYSKNSLFVIKETRHYKLYSNSQLKYLNKIIRDFSFQIIEIEGRICKSLILQLNDFKSYFELIYRELSQLDCLISCLIVSTTGLCNKANNVINDKNVINYKDAINDINYKNVINVRNVKDDRNVINIKNASDYLIENSVKTDYFIELNQFYLITGENMSGKTSYVRNMANIAILTRIGCFIRCNYIEMPLFDNVYFISTIEHINEYTRDITKLNYKSMNASINGTGMDCRINVRLVIVDELQCSLELQFNFINLILKSKVTALFITHSPAVIDFVKSKELKVYKYENFTFQEGANEKSSVYKICKKFIPELNITSK